MIPEHLQDLPDWTWDEKRQGYVNKWDESIFMPKERLNLWIQVGGRMTTEFVNRFLNTLAAEEKRKTS